MIDDQEVDRHAGPLINRVGPIFQNIFHLNGTPVGKNAPQK